MSRCFSAVHSLWHNLTCFSVTQGRMLLQENKHEWGAKKTEMHFSQSWKQNLLETKQRVI